MNCIICQKKLTEGMEYCESCSKEWEELQAFAEEMKSADFTSDPGELFWQKQRISILQKIHQPSAFSAFLRWATVFSLLLVSGLLFHHFYQKTESDTLSWELEEEETEVDITDLNEQEEEVYLSYLSQKISDLENEEDISVDDVMEDLNLEQLQKAIQLLEKENKQRRVL